MKNNKLHIALEEIDKRLAKFKDLSNTEYKIGVPFQFNEISETIDIQRTLNVYNLIVIVSYLVPKEKAFKDAIKALSIKKAPAFNWQGYSVKDWIHDAKLRLEFLKQDKEQRKLLATRGELQKFLTKEDQLDAILSSLEFETLKQLKE